MYETFKDDVDFITLCLTHSQNNAKHAYKKVSRLDEDLKSGYIADSVQNADIKNEILETLKLHLTRCSAIRDVLNDVESGIKKYMNVIERM